MLLVPVSMASVTVTAVATSVKTTETSCRAGIRAAVRAAMRSATVFLVFLVLLLLVPSQHVCSNCTGNHTTNSAQGSTAELISNECAASSTHQGRSETSLAFGTTRSTGSARLAIMLLLLLVGVTVSVLLWCAAIRLLRWRIGRISAVWVVTLIIAARWRGAVMLLWGGRSVWIMRRLLILALTLRIRVVPSAVLVMSARLTIRLMALSAMSVLLRGTAVLLLALMT